MSEGIQPAALSAEEVRLRERRAFDAFNEAQAARRQISRDKGNLAVAEENKRWLRPETAPGLDNGAGSGDEPD